MAPRGFAAARSALGIFGSRTKTRELRIAAVVGAVAAAAAAIVLVVVHSR